MSGINMAAMLAEAERLADNAGGGKKGFIDNFVKTPEKGGMVVIRLLPPSHGQELPYIASKVHKINDRNVHCRCELTNGRWGGDCPICDYYKYLYKERDKAEKQGRADRVEALETEARSIKGVEKYYYNAMVRGSDPEDGEANPCGQSEADGPLIFSANQTIHKKVLRAYAGDKAAKVKPIGDITDTATGRDLRIVKIFKPGNKWAEYDDSKFLEPSPLGTPDQVKAWKSKQHDLTTLRKVPSWDESDRELRIHLKLEEDSGPKTGFDPTKYSRPDSAPVVSEASAAVNSATPTSEPTPTPAVADEPMNKDDFEAALAAIDSIK
jgi:hypothetical protein